MVATVVLHHKEAIFLHDAIRNDVISSILSKDKQDTSRLLAIKKEFDEHYRQLLNHVEANMKAPLPGVINTHMCESQTLAKSYHSAAYSLMEANAGQSRDPLLMAQFETEAAKLKDELNIISTDLREWIENERKALGNNVVLLTVITCACFVVALGFTAFVFYVVLYTILAPLRQLTSTTKTLATGNMDVDIPGWERADEIGEMARALDGINDICKKALHITTALNDSSCALMITDDNYTIIYVNRALQKLIDRKEADIRKAVRSFTSTSLVGKNIDVFHRVPGQQRKILDRLTSPHVVTIRMNNALFQLTISPVFNDMQERVAMAVEWHDISDK